jgi:toxin ParE1/3/4
MRLILTRAAQRDLIEIGRTTQRTWGRQQRIIYLAALDKTFRLLAEYPEIGIDCTEIRLGYRKHPC